MKVFKTRRVVLNLIMPVLAGIILFLFSGCGGGNKGAEEKPPVPSENPQTGTFVVRVNVPGGEEKLSFKRNCPEVRRDFFNSRRSGEGSFHPEKGRKDRPNPRNGKESPAGARYIPTSKKWLKVTILGEKITDNFNQPYKLDIDGPASQYTMTVNNIPVGLNEAVIQVLDKDEKVIAQRRIGFYMTAGATTGPAGIIHMGIAIKPNGTCQPQNLRVPNGTTLYWENWDPVNNRTVKMNSNSVSIGPISKITQANQPNSVAVFHSASYTFGTNNTYNYDSGFGAPGYIKVGDFPIIHSITDSDGNNYDTASGSTAINFTITGENFGGTQGSVKFVKDLVHGNGTYNASVSTWNGTQITGSITIPEGAYLVVATSSGGEDTQERVCYYKSYYYWRYLDDYRDESIRQRLQIKTDAGLARNFGVYNGQIFVSLEDKDNSSYMTVMKYDENVGRYWEFTGSRGFSECPFNYPSFHVYNGAPYALYRNTLSGLITCKMYNGASWENIGNPEFSPDDYQDNSLYVYKGTPYVASQDWGDSGKISVMKFNGTDWEYVGARAFTEEQGNYPQLFIYDDGTAEGVPYVAYWDPYVWSISCMKFNGTSWDYVGERAFAPNPSNWLSLYVYEDTPYVAFRNEFDDPNHCSTYCMKFNGSDWENLGTYVRYYSFYPSVAVINGTPYVAGQDENGRIYCNRFNGTDWEETGAEQLEVYGSYVQIVENGGNIYVGYADLYKSYAFSCIKYNGIYWARAPSYWGAGDPTISAGSAQMLNLSINNGTPYIAYIDDENGNTATCRKFNGTSWETIGSAGFSPKINYDLSLSTYNGTPYVAFTNDNIYSQASCMKFNGDSWEYVGSESITENWAPSISLQINAGTPYILYCDGARDYKATCRKFEGGSWQDVGPPAFSMAEAGYVNLAFYNGTPYAAFSGAIHQGSMMKFNGDDWEETSAAIYADHATSYISAFLYNGTPYIVYEHYFNGYLTCKKFNGASWELVGDADYAYAEGNSLFVYKGTPYSIFTDWSNGGRLTFKRLAANGSVWEDVGSQGFTEDVAYWPSLNIYNDGSANGIPYVTYYDANYDNSISCAKFNGDSWEYVGSRGFTGYTNECSFSVYDNTPYVAFQDNNNGGRLTCAKFNGDSWETVGEPGFSEGSFSMPNISIYNGTPYVVFQDRYEYWGGGMTVMKFNGDSWESVGSPRSFWATWWPGLDFYNGTPYVYFAEYEINSRFSCVKFNGDDWERVGSQAFTQEPPYWGVTYAFYNGSPYFFCTIDSRRASCMKYNGTTWDSVGSQLGFSKAQANYISLAIYNSTPYVSYRDEYYQGAGTVKKFTGSGATGWESVGEEGFAPEVNDNAIRFDEATGDLYFAFVDESYGDMVSCLKFNGADWEYVGETHFTSGGVNENYIAFAIYGGVPYVAYADGDYVGRVTVKKYDYKP